MYVRRAPVERRIRDFWDVEPERAESASASDADVPLSADPEGRPEFEPLELVDRYSSLNEALRGVPFN